MRLRSRHDAETLRPLLLRLLPDRLRMAAWARLYRGKHARWSTLYENAELRYAPDVTMELVPGDLISDSIAFTGVYELALTRRAAALSRGGGTMIEVGANLGYFALLWAAGHPENRCIAFEASPRNLEILLRNIHRNGLASQVEVIPHAAGREAGKLPFDIGPIEQTGWGGFAPSREPGRIEVEVVRVDDVVKVDAPVALLKVDIEGADAWALMGCERLLRARAVREVWFEQNKPRMKALGIPPEAAQEYLRSLGYVPRPESETSEDVVEWSAVPDAS